MIKVLHYVGVMNRAGAETFIMNMFRSIDKKNYKFDFLCTVRKKGDYDNEIKELGGEMFYVDLSKKNGVFRHIENYNILKHEFKKYILKYDVIHIHTYHAFDMYIPTKAAVMAGFKKVIAHSHSNSADGHMILHKIFRNKLSKLSIVKMACTDEAWKWMFSKGEEVIIGNGINAVNYKYSNLKRIEKRKEFGIGNEIVIGHVGRFDPVKNHTYLIDVFFEFNKKHPTSKLLLIGKGREYKNILEKCKSYNIDQQVIFAGVRDDVNELLQAMDVFVFPSTYEGFGIAIIEAEASGLPCVVSDNVPNDVDVCCVKHISLNESAYKWSVAIEETMAQTIYRENEYNKIIAAKYDVKENCERLMEIYAKK